MRTQCTEYQSQKIPGVSMMVLKASSFSDSTSGDTDPSDEELDDDPDDDDDDSDDDLERESLLSSSSLVRNPSLLGIFFEVISWVVLLLGIDIDLVSEVDPFLLCHERIRQRSLPQRTLPEFDIVINFENSLLIKNKPVNLP